MLILEPICDQPVWGGTRLLPYVKTEYRQIGHLYSVYDASQSNIIRNGIYAGDTFHKYFEKNKERFHLEKYERYPVVVALVDAADNLSIQVHPDDIMAKQLEGMNSGKNESWYFLEEPWAGWIFNGCRVDSKEEAKRMVQEGKTGEIVGHLPVQKGDYVYVKAGTLHALSKGSLVCEIEENRNLTYRLYDYNRVDSQGNMRELHIDKALQSLHPKNISEVKRYGNEEIQERLYSTRLLENAPVYENRSKTIESITLLEGSMELEGLQLSVGSGIILEPKERITLQNVKAIAVRVNENDEVKK